MCYNGVTSGYRLLLRYPGLFWEAWSAYLGLGAKGLAERRNGIRTEKLVAVVGAAGATRGLDALLRAVSAGEVFLSQWVVGFRTVSYASLYNGWQVSPLPPNGLIAIGKQRVASRLCGWRVVPRPPSGQVREIVGSELDVGRAGDKTIVTMVAIGITSYSMDHVDTEIHNETKLPIEWGQLNSVSKNSVLENKSSLTVSELEVAVNAGNDAIVNQRHANLQIRPLLSPSPNSRHQKAVSTSITAGKLALAAVGEIAATKVIENIRNTNNRPSAIGQYFNGGWVPIGGCKEYININCKNNKYRSFDGTCNHPKHYGAAFTPFRRVLYPDYADKINAPRVGKFGNPLPSAREISIRVHKPSPSTNPSFTVMLAVFGQFLDHDITGTALSQGINGSSISCCHSTYRHPECFPVRVRHGDPVYNVTGNTCMEFIRSAPAPQCKIGPRQQLNQVTAFIDGSAIYGSDIETSNSLREGEGGLLRMYVSPDNRTLLPISTDAKDGCNKEVEMKRGRYCFATGDKRANENLHLTTMHLIWARQHNFIAKRLREMNSFWNDEKIFQETRRIIIAQLQHITYREFLPIILGHNITDSENMKPLQSGYRNSENTEVDPSIANNFAAAAFRFAHTLLPGLMKMADAEKNTEFYTELHRMLFNPYDLYTKNGIEKAVKSALTTPIQKTSTHVTPQLTQHLFEDPVAEAHIPCGLDLVSLNIQRGRDHGLPSYTLWRQHCGLSKPATFFDLVGNLDPEALKEISDIYENVDDIDLYTGALAEIVLSDGIVGPTFTCLLTEQFVRLQTGDNYWYEKGRTSFSFTKEQLDEIRKTTLAKIICDCSDNITKIQVDVMRYTSIDNPTLNCEDVPGLSMNAWKDE